MSSWENAWQAASCSPSCRHWLPHSCLKWLIGSHWGWEWMASADFSKPNLAIGKLLMWFGVTLAVGIESNRIKARSHSSPATTTVSVEDKTSSEHLLHMQWWQNSRQIPWKDWPIEVVGFWGVMQPAILWQGPSTARETYHEKGAINIILCMILYYEYNDMFASIILYGTPTCTSLRGNQKGCRTVATWLQAALGSAKSSGLCSSSSAKRQAAERAAAPTAAPGHCEEASSALLAMSCWHLRRRVLVFAWILLLLCYIMIITRYVDSCVCILCQTWRRLQESFLNGGGANRQQQPTTMMTSNSIYIYIHRNIYIYIYVYIG